MIHRHDYHINVKERIGNKDLVLDITATCRTCGKAPRGVTPSIFDERLSFKRKSELAEAEAKAILRSRRAESRKFHSIAKTAGRRAVRNSTISTVPVVKITTSPRLKLEATTGTTQLITRELTPAEKRHQTRLAREGSDYRQRAGRKGAKTLRQRYGADYYNTLGKAGTAAAKKKLAGKKPTKPARSTPRAKSADRQLTARRLSSTITSSVRGGARRPRPLAASRS